MLAMGAQVAATIAIPLLLGAVVGSTIDRSVGSEPWGLLASILVGLVVAGIGVFLLLRRYLAEHPAERASEAARAAGRRWETEIEAEERRREEERS